MWRKKAPTKAAYGSTVTNQTGATKRGWEIGIGKMIDRANGKSHLNHVVFPFKGQNQWKLAKLASVYVLLLVGGTSVSSSTLIPQGSQKRFKPIQFAY